MGIGGYISTQHSESVLCLMDGVEESYCPYLDIEFPSSEMSKEHIIPLALGGVDAFSIRVSREANSRFGHAIDGALANNFLMSLRRARGDVRGHSGKPVKAKWRGEDEKGNPLQGLFSSDCFSLFDPRAGRPLSVNERPAKFVFKSTLQQFLHVSFASKVALGTGYFLFPELFHRHAAHDQLRTLFQPVETIPEETLKENTILYMDLINHFPHQVDHPRHRLVVAMMDSLGCSCVFVDLIKGAIVFSIGLMGYWIATITVEADDQAFMQKDGYEKGRAFILKDGTLHEMTMHDAFEGYRKSIDAKI